jgi:hypothetical protein
MPPPLPASAWPGSAVPAEAASRTARADAGGAAP